MVHHHRSFYHQLRKGGEAEQHDSTESSSYHLPLFYYDYFGHKRTKPRLFGLVFFFSLVSCSLLLLPRLLFGSSAASLPFFYSFGEQEAIDLQNSNSPYMQEQNRSSPCSSVSNNTICCDRTGFRSDVCFMRGDVRTHSSSKSIFLFSNSNNSIHPSEEKIRPYTRKWETSVMDTIDELSLIRLRGDPNRSCDVHHDVPAVVFSTGGYTGNVYHEFNDGLLPLYISSQHFNKQVVFVMLEYHSWWITKYGDVLSRLSDYPPIDFSNDSRTHCFPEAVVGLRIHDELTVDSTQMGNTNKSIGDFRRLLDEAYTPRIRSILQEEEQIPKKEVQQNKTQKPKLVIVSRNGSRAIENERELVKLGEEVGFVVDVLRPEKTTEMAKIYRSLNSSDAMIGVHGAAMTHFLFMRPGSVFIQVVPLGTDWAAETYYGEPAVKLGLRYVGYKILPKESSLFRHYEKDDPVLRDPESVNAKGWEVTKKVYLDGQNVRLDLSRFRKRLVRAHQYLVSKKKKKQGR